MSVILDGAAIAAAVLAARLRIAEGLVPGFLAMRLSSNSRLMWGGGPPRPG